MFSCDDDDDGFRRVRRGRSIGVGLDRSAEDGVTLSLRLTASEADLVGMGMQYFVPRHGDAPARAPSPRSVRTHPEAQSASYPKKGKDTQIQRIFRLRMPPMTKRQGERGLFCSMMLWLLSTAGAALVVCMPNRMIQP